MPIESGQELLHYRIVDKIGEGGMGAVWKAVDTTLGREVAIKVLPVDFVMDPDRLARFEREARLLASLNHPNIAVLHGLHEFEGERFLAMELIEGEDLAARLSRGPMPVEEALQVAAQVASALEIAHDKGIVHRDLKPANIILTPDDRAKVLDFGLAKSVGIEDASGDTASSPTMTSAGTVVGMVLGTAGYMSPEQAKGKPVDRRADVWAFGAVLYEMLTGRCVFEGENVSDTLASVIKSEPEWQVLPTEVPPAVRRLLRRCLQKQPKERLRDVGDARLVIEDVLAGRDDEAPGGVVTAVPVKAKPPVVAWAATLIAAVVVTAALAWWMRPAPAPAVPRHFEIAVGGEYPMFSSQGPPAVSADGRYLAYTIGLATDTSTSRVLLRDLGRLDTITFAGMDGSYNPFFSPDGRWIGFATPTELKKISISGGTPLTLTSVSLSRGASWGEQGTIAFAPTPASGLKLLPEAGGTAVELTQLADGEVSHRWPQFLPGGEQVLFTSYSAEQRDAGNIEIVDVASGERTVVHRGGTCGIYSRSGHLLYSNQGTLFAAGLDLKSRTLTGLPAPVIEEVATNSEGAAQVAVAPDGTLAYLTGSAVDRPNNLIWVDREGRETLAIEAERQHSWARLSPDGNRVAVEVTVEGMRDIWIYDLLRGTQTRLTFDTGTEFYPVWTPDGKHVIYGSNALGNWGVFRVSADGASTPELIPGSARDVVLNPYSVSPDGKYLVYHDQGEDGDILVLALDGSEPARTLYETPGFAGDPVFSPDGRWVAYDADDTGNWEIYVRPFPGPGGKWQVSIGGGEFARWSGDGKTLFYRRRDGSVWSVAVNANDESIGFGQPEQLFQFEAGGAHDWDVSDDGRRFLFVQETRSVDAGPNLIKLRLNWFEELDGLLVRN